MKSQRSQVYAGVFSRQSDIIENADFDVKEKFRKNGPLTFWKAVYLSYTSCHYSKMDLQLYN